MNSQEHTRSKFLLQMRGIVKEFSGVRVLHGVDFNLLSGEVMALMGEKIILPTETITLENVDKYLN